MKKTNNKYLLFGLVGLLVVGAVVVLSQNAGQTMQGDLIRSVTPTTTDLTTTSTTSSYTAPDQTTLTLARIEGKIDTLTSLVQAQKLKVDALTSSLQAQNTKIDTLNSSLTKFRTKVNVFAKELASMVFGVCNSSSNTIFANCSTSFTRISVEAAII